MATLEQAWKTVGWKSIVNIEGAFLAPEWLNGKEDQINADNYI